MSEVPPCTQPHVSIGFLPEGHTNGQQFFTSLPRISGRGVFGVEKAKDIHAMILSCRLRGTKSLICTRSTLHP